MNQIELRRQAISDRFNHAWSKSSTRIPIPLKEYRALLDLWEAASSLITNEGFALKSESVSLEKETVKVEKALEKLEKGG